MTREQLHELEVILRIAHACAQKLGASYVRGEIAPRHEYERLMDIQERIWDYVQIVEGEKPSAVEGEAEA